MLCQILLIAKDFFLHKGENTHLVEQRADQCGWGGEWMHQRNSGTVKQMSKSVQNGGLEQNSHPVTLENRWLFRKNENRHKWSSGGKEYRKQVYLQHKILKWNCKQSKSWKGLWSERWETRHLHRRLTANNVSVNGKVMNRKDLEGEKFDSEFSWNTENRSSAIGITTSCGRFHFVWA